MKTLRNEGMLKKKKSSTWKYKGRKKEQAPRGWKFCVQVGAGL